MESLAYDTAVAQPQTAAQRWCPHFEGQQPLLLPAAPAVPRRPRLRPRRRPAHLARSSASRSATRWRWRGSDGHLDPARLRLRPLQRQPPCTPGPAASPTRRAPWSRRCCSPGRCSRSPSDRRRPRRSGSPSSPPSPRSRHRQHRPRPQPRLRPPDRAAAPAHRRSSAPASSPTARRPPRAPQRVRAGDDRPGRRRRPHPQRRRSGCRSSARSTQLDEVLEECNVDRVIIAFSRASHQQLLSCIRTCRDHRVAVDVVPRLFELLDGAQALTQIGGLPVISIGAPPLTRTPRASPSAASTSSSRRRC